MIVHAACDEKRSWLNTYWCLYPRSKNKLTFRFLRRAANQLWFYEFLPPPYTCVPFNNSPCPLKITSDLELQTQSDVVRLDTSARNAKKKEKKNHGTGNQDQQHHPL